MGICPNAFEGLVRLMNSDHLEFGANNGSVELKHVKDDSSIRESLWELRKVSIARL